MNADDIMPYFVLVIGLIIISLLMVFVMSITNTISSRLPDSNTELNTNCENMCTKFNYEFYRVEKIHTYYINNYYCWCLKDNDPISLGGFYHE